MAMYVTDPCDQAIAPPRRRAISMERYGSMECLPAGYENLFSPTIKRLKSAAQAVSERLRQNDDTGNQYIFLRNISERTRDRLDSEPHLLGVPFRFMFDKDGAIGIIKILPSVSHDATTENIKDEIRDRAIAMGVDKHEMCWGGTATHQGNNQGKQPDQFLSPGSRQPRGGQIVAWPTLVIETGVTESLPRLREDAKWWFANSNGDVRIVLVVCIRRGQQKKVLLEKWQLAPPNTLSPVTGTRLRQLRQQNPLPPTGQQIPAVQQPFALQEITITPKSAVGAPLVLPFEAIFDRACRGNEADIVITENVLVDDCIRHV